MGRSCFLFTFFLILSFPLIAIDSSFPQAFEVLTHTYLPNGNVGLIIQDPKAGKILFERRAHENFHPASNTKLFTAAAALKFLGPQFQFETTLRAPLNRIQKGILHSPLYLVFTGDPSLTIQDLSSLLKQLKAQGIYQIQGDIIIDDHAFKGATYAPGWTWDSMPWAYSAPITSIILNENKVQLKFNKPLALHELIKVELISKAFPRFNIKGKVTAASLEEATHTCELNAQVKESDIFLQGCWPFDKTPTIVELAIDNPRSLLTRLLQKQLKGLGLTLTGKIRFGEAPKNMPALVIKRSPPLKDLLLPILGDSNNVYTESITKALGLAYSGQGTFQAGTHAIQEILEKAFPLTFSEASLSDGSGQSRYNLVSPYLISTLLYHMYHDPTFPTFYSALSVSGKKGSLATRLKEKTVIGKVVAKTGSLKGISALSGYLTTQTGEEYLFSILINQSNQDYHKLKLFEDKLCELLMETHF